MSKKWFKCKLCYSSYSENTKGLHLRDEHKMTSSLARVANDIDLFFELDEEHD